MVKFGACFACLALGIMGCGGRSIADGDVPATASESECVPGRQLACDCESGATAIQVCLSDKTFGPCSCGSGGNFGSGGSTTTRATATVSSGGATTAFGGAIGTTNTPVTGSGGSITTASGTELSTGTKVLVDAFPAPTGLFIVLSDSIILVDRSGIELARVDSPREITAAAFDGERLVVADKARLTTYDLNLASLATGTLVEACASAVLVSGALFICGPSNDWDRVFYTYDANSGALLASSLKYTYNGIPMRRIPGTDDFITVSIGTSPTDFFLYRVDATHVAVFVSDSPYHGDFAISNTFAFYGSPPTHVITSQGLLLKIFGTNCSTATSSTAKQCFVKDGALGTLTGAQMFVGMDNDASGTVYGLVDPSFTYSNGPCASSCIVQRVDSATRSVVNQKIYAFDSGAIVVARHDPVSNALLVGYRIRTSTYYSSSDRYPGYRVRLLPYE